MATHMHQIIKSTPNVYHSNTINNKGYIFIRLRCLKLNKAAKKYTLEHERFATHKGRVHYEIRELTEPPGNSLGRDKRSH